ncbi:Hypothetical protein PHPALM_13621 [Phytophthora palmivora]|uniref:HAT C-terminal dimerisation domain-containing protein n=1 Tax=Phytophthora palmivora TaxID=4796 RepID=A0A2P4XWU0_9STRA|nr:Hypothetical protein PHPALM_13621 [Phytophthora palmivora]
MSEPLQWWGTNRDDYPHLFEIARRIFTMPTSSAATERSWSIHKFIHSDRRNRLKTEKVRKLVFKYSNCEDNTSIPEVVFDGVTLKRKEGGNNSDDEGEPLAISDENDASSSSSDDEKESDGDRDGDTEANADNYVDTSYDYPYSQE